jgi:hypothetical protein
MIADNEQFRNGLVVTEFWKAKPRKTDAVVNLRRFASEARHDVGVQISWLTGQRWSPRNSSSMRCSKTTKHSSRIRKTVFQRTDRPRNLPKLAKCERDQYTLI